MVKRIALAREVVIAGESPRAAARASELSAAWEPVIEAREDEAPGGPLNVLATFEALAQEIADPRRQWARAAANRARTVTAVSSGAAAHTSALKISTST